MKIIRIIITENDEVKEVKLIKENEAIIITTLEHATEIISNIKNKTQCKKHSVETDSDQETK